MYPRGATSVRQPSLADDSCIKGLSKLASAVKGAGAGILVQICHHGKTSRMDTKAGRPVLIPTEPAPEVDMSSFLQDLTMDELMGMAETTGGQMPHYGQATEDELFEVVEAFAAAAERVERAGCDGVEIHACHGYLISTFLSPFWNRRTDRFGGSVENRARLLTEIITVIRERTGEDFVVTVRIDANEYELDGGITPELAAEHALLAEAAGVDAVHVSAIANPGSGPGFTDGPVPWTKAHYRDLTRPIKAAVKVPVISVGRIEPDDADEMIALGETDFVSMGRQLLADPNLPVRLKESKPELIRPCINCYVCVAQNFWDGIPKCAVNAQLGRPPLDPEPALEPKRIVVIGAGPAGLEFGRVAAGRGHTVVVLERSKHVGGTARFSAVTTPANEKLVDYLQAAAAEAGVTVQTDIEATPALVQRLKPDRVVVATGALRSRPDIQGADAKHVLTGDDLRAMLTGDVSSRAIPWALRPGLAVARKLKLTSPDKVRDLSRRWMPIGRDVVVIGGGLVGVEIAEFLAERGRSVTVVESGDHHGLEMAHPRRWRTMQQARSHGVEFMAQATVTEITDNTVLITATVGDDSQKTKLGATTVIVANGVGPGGSLIAELSDLGLVVDVIGDARHVGYIEGAIADAYDLASKI